MPESEATGLETNVNAIGWLPLDEDQRNYRTGGAAAPTGDAQRDCRYTARERNCSSVKSFKIPCMIPESRNLERIICI